MRIAMIGTGYVGLVTGTCLAETGNDVVCVDIDRKKVRALKRGEIPIYEPGLEELVKRNTSQGRLSFTTELPSAVAGADMVFIAVGTPQGDDGSADLSGIWKVADSLADCLEPQSIVVIKSTVPVGTNTKLFKRLVRLTGRRFNVASNPEFLKEGAAIEDFMRPDRVVVGVRRQSVADKLAQLYRPFLRTEKPFLSMSPESAEMTKYVANALLATKISFINEVANLCERMAADINDVRRGIGHDNRIGFKFLFPGVGYGGSCFPKDVRALEAMARQLGLFPRMIVAVDQVNDAQKTVLMSKVEQELGPDPRGKKIAVWGLAFKPQTDDVREAPALEMINRLLELGVKVHVHDPEAMENVRAQYQDRLAYASNDGPYSALEGAHGLVICTDWKEYQNPDFARMRKLMRAPVIFDGRNLFEPAYAQSAGFTYHSIGRASVKAKPPGKKKPAAAKAAAKVKRPQRR